MGFAHLLNAKWLAKTASDLSIPGGDFHTRSDTDSNDPTVVRLLKILKNCKYPFPDWDFRSRQMASNECYLWAEYAGLNDFFQIPRRDPNRPAHEYGIDGAEVTSLGTRANNFGPYLVAGDGNEKRWWTALFTEYGKWRGTKKDSFGNYEDLPWVLFLYFNDLPKGTEPIFPADAPASAAGQAPPAPSNPTGAAARLTRAFPH